MRKGMHGLPAAATITAGRACLPFARRSSGIVLALVAALSLSACVGGGVEDLQEWMDEQARLTRPRVQPLGEAKVFIPESYAGAGDALDPFSPMRLALALVGPGTSRPESGEGASLLAVEQRRVREELENYPLDAMRMVGTMRQNGEDVALLQINELLYSVRRGQYLGTAYGRIVGITENSIHLRELVQEAGGQWVEKHTEIHLKEEGR